MRRWFYHTDLEKNAVLHNFAGQIALIQYSGRSKHERAFSQTELSSECVQYSFAPKAPKLARKWFPCGADGRSLGRCKATIIKFSRLLS